MNQFRTPNTVQIENTCVRCRKVYSTISIVGDDTVTSSHFGTTNVCMRCGGMVYPVKDTEVLPYEFVGTRKRVFRAALWSAVLVPIVWCVCCVAIAVPNVKDISLPVNPLAWTWPIFVIASLVSFSYCWVQASVAKRCNLNPPQPANEPSPLEGVFTVAMALPVAVLAVVLFVFLVPTFVDTDHRLRGPVARIIAGAIAGLVGSAMTTRYLFQCGRRAPPKDKVWHLGEEPT